MCPTIDSARVSGNFVMPTFAKQSQRLFFRCLKVIVQVYPYTWIPRNTEVKLNIVVDIFQKFLTTLEYIFELTKFEYTYE